MHSYYYVCSSYAIANFLTLVHVLNYFRFIFYISGNRSLQRTIESQQQQRVESYQSEGGGGVDESPPQVATKIFTLWFHGFNVFLHCSATLLFNQVCRKYVFNVVRVKGANKTNKASSTGANKTSSAAIERRERVTAKLAVTLFALHPIHTEAVRANKYTRVVVPKPLGYQS